MRIPERRKNAALKGHAACMLPGKVRIWNNLWGIFSGRRNESRQTSQLLELKALISQTESTTGWEIFKLKAAVAREP